MELSSIGCFDKIYMLRRRDMVFCDLRMGFKTFVAVYLSIIIAVSTFVIFAAPRLQTQNEASSSNHFSVQWMGFAPTDYSSEYPEYYICINNLKSDPLTMQIALQIKNQEDSGYYFVVTQYSTPPSGWTILTFHAGYIDIDETKAFVYQNASRVLPSSISGGRLTETITLVVKAYYDEYVTLYSQDYFDVTFNFIDRSSSAWSILYHDDFHDATVQDWTTTYEGGEEISSCDYGASISPSDQYYRTFQYSLRLDTWAIGVTTGNPGYWYNYYAAWVWGAYRKSFEIPYTSESYLIFSIRSDNWDAFDLHGIRINGTTYFKSDAVLSTNLWFQYVVPLKKPTVEGETCTNIVDIWTGYVYRLGGPPYGGSEPSHTYAYLDDVYVIVK